MLISKAPTKNNIQMGAHAKSKERSRTVLVQGLMIREFPQYLEIRFTPFTSPWPLLLKRIRTAGVAVKAKMDRRPVLRVETNLDNLITLLEPRAKRSRLHSRLTLAFAAGFAVLLAGVFLPVQTVNTKLTSKPKVVDECTSERVSRTISGDLEASEIEFLESSTFGGVTSGIIRCEGSRYSYTLESKGDERVLKVQKLDT